MNAPRTYLRGFTVLCLALLAPCARALTVQSITFDETNSAFSWSSSANSYSVSWAFAPYTGSEPLRDVKIAMEVNAFVSAVELNPFPPTYPGKETVYESLILTLSSHFALLVGGAVADDTLGGPAVQLPYGGSTSLSGALNTYHEMAITDPQQVALFDGSTPGPLLMWVKLGSSQSYGFHGGTFNATATISYNVPDSGSVLWLALAALGLVFGAHIKAAPAFRR